MVTQAFVHRALLYEGAHAYVREVGRFAREGLAAGEHVMVGARPDRLALLREDLGDLAGGVDLVDATVFYRRIGTMFGALTDHLRRYATPGRGRARVVSEPPLQDRPAAEVRCLLRHEAAANVALRPFGATVICPYDVGALPDDVIEHAVQAHPEIVRDGCALPSPDPVDPAELVRRLVAPEPVPAAAPSQPLRRVEDLADARRLVRTQATAAGLPAGAVEDLLLAANEIAENALLHGGPPRRLWCWAAGGAVQCRVRDGGDGLRDPLAGYLPPGTTEQSGRGLWLAGQLCDAVEVSGDGAGTDVTLRVRVPPAA